MITIYHEEFLKTATSKIKEITELERAGKKVEAAKASFDFAKYKVAYYEQFISGSDPITNYEKIYEDDYYWALVSLGVARDKCMDLGIYEQTFYYIMAPRSGTFLCQICFIGRTNQPNITDTYRSSTCKCNVNKYLHRFTKKLLTIGAV